MTTLDPDEPTATCAQFQGIESTVWYTFTPAEDIIVIADTFESNYDTIIAVWTESDDGLAEVACNDDFIGQRIGTEPLTTPGLDLLARIAFRGSVGQTYLIQAGRYGGGLNEFNFNSLLNFGLDVGVPLANDDLLGATTITALPFADGPLDIRNATVNPDEPRSGCAFGGVRATVWYTFTSQEDVDVITNTIGSDFDRALAVWTDDGSGLEELGCENSFLDEAFPIAFRAAAGQTYFIQVTQIGFFGPTGSDLVFSLEEESPSTEETTGDVNCNGMVSAFDAALVLQFNAGLLGSLPCSDGADVDGDHNISSIDAALILQFTAGLLDSLPS